MDTKNVENFDPNAPFDFKTFHNLLSEICADIDNINNHFVFTNFCRETVKVFQELGGILKKAFEDIHAKCNIIRGNYNQHKEFHTGLLPFIQIEKAMDIARLNGENGDFLIGTDMDKYKDYESTARTVLRLMWFLDFVSEMLKGVINNRKDSLSSICSDAYKIALAPNHPKHIVMAVKAGMLLVPSREKLIEILFSDKKQKNPYENMEVAVSLLDIIRQRLWAFYKEQGLTKLP